MIHTSRYNVHAYISKKGNKYKGQGDAIKLIVH